MAKNELTDRTPISGPAGRKMVGYYAAWAVNSDFLPTQIDATKLTHLNYAFARYQPGTKDHFRLPQYRSV